MPRGIRNPLPDLADVDPAELQLAILVVLEERLGPQVREHLRLRRMQFGDALSLVPGGARHVLAQALARNPATVSKAGRLRQTLRHVLQSPGLGRSPSAPRRRYQHHPGT